MRRRARSSAARRANASAIPVRWAAFLFKASPRTTSFPSFTRSPGEPVVDKPGKGAFYATNLGLILANRGIENLLVCGVTTEVCVNTTVREANDRGFRCIVLSDCCGSYFPEFHKMGLAMIKAQGGIFGW
ncbi:MAG: cysteine hydrolase [Pseudolabrys sp.]